MHWTMHHGATFSAQSKIDLLSNKVDKEFEKINTKIDKIQNKK